MITAAVGISALLLCLAVVYRLLRHWVWQRRLKRFAVYARQITVHPPPEVDPGSAREFWSNLTGLLRPAYKRLISGQPHLAFEYVWDAHTVTIRLWIPGSIPPGLVERAVEAAWPSARTETTDPTPLLPLGGVVVGGRLRLGRPDYFPLRTDHRADPLRAAMGAASGLALHDHACVQLAARPATGRRLARANRAAAALRGGHSEPWRGRLFDLISPVRSGVSATRVYIQHPERAGEVRAILDKATEPQWEVAIRYALGTEPPGPPPPQKQAVRRRLRGRAHALASAYAVFTGRNYLTRRRTWNIHKKLDDRWLGHGDLLSVTELAALAHLPLDPAVPGVHRAGARAVPPSPVIATPGPHVKPLGIADAGTHQHTGISIADARHHLHILGANGTGKSTLIARMVLADVADGRGAAVIDPKGDLIVDLLARLPEEAASKVVLFDPGDRRVSPPALNVLQGPDRDLVADNLVGIFHRIYVDSWGPRTDDILRSACLTLWQQPSGSLTDIPQLLTDATYRNDLTSNVDDPILLGFWRWYDGLSEAARSHVTGPVLNKLRAFLLRDFIRSAVGTSDTTIDLTQILDGGLLLVRAAKGLLGADSAALFGSLIVAKVWETVSHRARLGQSARRDCALYVDEAHNFLNLPHGLADMLAEARAFRLSVVLAHQNLSQLDRELREAISANARSKVYFATSPEDARDIERHVAPNLTQHDLVHLGGFQAAARLIVNGAETPAFTLRTQPLPAPIPSREKVIRHAANNRSHTGTGQPTPTRLNGDPRLPQR